MDGWLKRLGLKPGVECCDLVSSHHVATPPRDVKADVMEFKRRICGPKKRHNELYRSNSFKFERFEREDSTVTNQVSLCDDYSVPVDFVNKHHPHCFGANLVNWTTPSPSGEPVEIVAAYCDPRDSKSYLAPGEEVSCKLYTSPDRDYSLPYTDTESTESRLASDAGVYEDVSFNNCVTVIRVGVSDEEFDEELEQAFAADLGPRPTPKRNPSPYYYSDLTQPDVDVKTQGYRKSISLDTPSAEGKKSYRKCVSLDTDHQPPSIFEHDSLLGACLVEWEFLMPPLRALTAAGPCVCAARDDDVEEEKKHRHRAAKKKRKKKRRKNAEVRDGEVEDMSGRRRHQYETAFDCKVSRSDDDLDEADRVTNHHALQMFGSGVKPEVSSTVRRLVRGKLVRERPKSIVAKLPVESSLSRDLDDLDLDAKEPATCSRLKDLRLPVKSLRARECRPRSCEVRRSDEPIVEFKGRPKQEARVDVREIKDRPSRGIFKCHPRLDKRLDLNRVKIREIKGRPFSSTESMATSSSGGSLESIRSSTSEGNRSTSSSESQQSASLSSHSSDSVENLPRIFARAQLHILSPISDKSSLEPASETSDNNRNNNSQKATPDEAPEIVAVKVKRQNKHLVKLECGSELLGGSDSGISVESRSTTKHNKFSSFIKLGAAPPAGVATTDLTDLPFDMPKLRRRRLLQQDTSGSATSVDLNDLPFDMPKLRRRLRCGAETSVAAVGGGGEALVVVSTARPGLTLNLDGGAKPPGLSLNLGGTTAANDLVDDQLPLERQGWYHGAITRLEAECVLRALKEGSYLVRNSESARQDYSLSLKSARGFMHMRIQPNPTSGKFILGEFSKPFDNIPAMIRHYSVNRLPIRGAEHMCLMYPVIEPLL